MNIYTTIILATLIIGFLLDLIIDMLNLKALGRDLPEEFSDVFDDEKYRKSQDYTRVRTRFGMISTAISLVVLLIFWFAGGFNYADSLAANIADSMIWQGLIFVALLVGANFIFSLPFTIYSTFVIEKKFGFNKTTAKVFITDQLKSMALSVIIGGPLLALLIYLLDSYGENAWLYGWAAVTIISFILQYLAPRFIMPLFNKFTPLEVGPLRNSIMTYAKYVGFKVSDVFVIDGSKRSTKSNAFFTGFGRNRRIALYDTLIEKHSDRELLAILAHEVGHFKKKHIQKSMIISVLHTGFIFWLLSVFLGNSGLHEAFFMDRMTIWGGLIFFALLYSPVEMLLSIVMNIFSRRNEYQADRFAVETTNNRQHMIDALKKLSGDNLSNLTPHPATVFMNYSHPPVLKRIEAIRDIELESEE